MDEFCVSTGCERCISECIAPDVFPVQVSTRYATSGIDKSDTELYYAHASNIHWSERSCHVPEMKLVVSIIWLNADLMPFFSKLN